MPSSRMKLSISKFLRRSNSRLLVPLMNATEMAVGLAATVLQNRKMIWQEVQTFIDKKMMKNSRTTLHTKARDGKCELILRELDIDGKVINEKRWTIDSLQKTISTNDQHGTSTEYTNDIPYDQITPYVSTEYANNIPYDSITPYVSTNSFEDYTGPHRVLSWEQVEHPECYSSRQHQKHNKKYRKKEVTEYKPALYYGRGTSISSDGSSLSTSTLTNSPHYGRAASVSTCSSGASTHSNPTIVRTMSLDSASSQVSSGSCGSSTQVASSASSRFENDDDDLYEMPKYGKCNMKQKTSSWSRPNFRAPSNFYKSSKSSMSSRWSKSSISDEQSIPPAHPNYADSDLMSISEASILTVETHSTVYTTASNQSYASNNDFLEYERRLRESDTGFHNLQNMRPPAHRMNFASDTQSTISSTAPSLTYSSMSAVTEDSWQAQSSVQTELETACASDVSTIDGDSIIIQEDDLGSVGPYPAIRAQHY